MSDSNVPPHELEIPVDKEMADRIASEPEPDDVSAFLVAGEDPLASMPMNGSLLQDVSEEEIKQKQKEFEELVNAAQQEHAADIAQPSVLSAAAVNGEKKHTVEAPAAKSLELPKEASNEDTVSSMVEDLKEDASLFVNHTIAELALEAKGLAIFPYIDKKKIAEHKLAYQMKPFERFMARVRQSRTAPLSDEVILKGFVDSGLNLKGHSGNTPLLTELDVMPSDGSLGLTGVRINSYGPQLNKLSELDESRLRSALESARKSFSTLQARAGDYVEYTGQNTGFMQAMLKFTEGGKVSSAYKEHENNIRALLEIRSVMDMRGFDLASFDREINKDPLFTPIFAKKHTRSWESFSQTLKKTDVLVSKIKRDMDGFLQSSKVQDFTASESQKPANLATQSDISAVEQSIKPSAESPPPSTTSSKGGVDVEYFGVKYKFADEDLAKKLLALDTPTHPPKGFKFAHPEIPLIWGVLKLTNPALLKKNELLPHFLYIDDRLPDITDPSAQIMDYLTHGDEGIEASSYSFYKHHLSDLNCQVLPDAFRNAGISSSLISDIKNIPAPNGVSREYPFTDSPSNAIRKADVMKHIPSDGRKLISPSIALAWECHQRDNKQTMESLTTNSFFGKKGPSTDALKALGVLDKFGEKIQFPDCFYTDESSPDLGESGDVIVMHYIDLCKEHGIEMANKLFDKNDFQGGRIPSPPDQYFLSQVGAQESFVSDFYESRAETDKRLDMIVKTTQAVRRQGLKTDQASGMAPPAGRAHVSNSSLASSRSKGPRI